MRCGQTVNADAGDSVCTEVSVVTIAVLRTELRILKESLLRELRLPDEDCPGLLESKALTRGRPKLLRPDSGACSKVRLEQDICNEEDGYVAVPDTSGGSARLGTSHTVVTAAMLVQSPNFNRAMVLFVLANALCLAVETDYTARHWLRESPSIFHVLAWIFCLIFTIELVLRIVGNGLHVFLCGFERWWNIFDFILVALQICEVGTEFLEGSSRMLPRLVQVSRFSRVARVARVMHLVPEFRQLLVSILTSVKSMLYIFLLILIYTVIASIFVTALVTEHKTSVGQDGMEQQEELERYFGSVGRSMLSLYKTISDGIHWGELEHPLVTFVSPYLTWLVVFYTASMVFALMNVITAFFVETALRVAKSEADNQLTRDLWAMFHTKGDGHVISEAEFMSKLDEPDMVGYLNELGLTADEVRDSDFFQLLDVDNSGGLDVGELVQGCSRLTGGAKAYDLAAAAFLMRQEIQNNVQHRAAMRSEIGAIQRRLCIGYRRRDGCSSSDIIIDM